MADQTYTLEAVLKARDEGFTSGMKAAAKQAESFGARLKKGFSFGIFSSIGTKAVNLLTGSISDMASEMSSSQASWKTFEGNMRAVHGTSKNTAKSIRSIRSELQNYAQKTIYSSSDMATTFSQLDAVGIKSADKLVTAFGGLASAAENPVQAMKTLSQQGTQMAAKPMVAWQDFKLMLEQSPAGMAMVAKKMGMSTGELVAAVQDGTVSTQDFFDAVEKVGNSKAMQKQAMQYKTVGQAMDGLKETMANTLLPAFNVLSDAAIKAISDITDAIGKIDADKLSGKLKVFVKNIGKYVKPLVKTAGEVAKAFLGAFKEILKGLTGVNSAFGTKSSVKSWSDGVKTAGDALKKFAGFLKKHGETIGKMLPKVAELALAFKAFSVVKTLVGPMQGFAKAIVGMAGKGIKGLAAKLFGIGAGEKEAGAGAVEAVTPVKDIALAFLALGAGVLMASAGFFLLAGAAVKLAESGPTAVGVMFGLIGALALLAYGASLIGPALASGAVGFVALGAGLLLAGAGMLVAAFAVQVLVSAAINLANAGPTAIGVLAGMAVGLAAFVIIVGVLAPTVLAGGAALLVFGAALLIIAAAVYIAAAGVAVLAGALPAVSAYGGSAAGAMVKLAGGLLAIGAASLVAGPGLLIAAASVAILAAGMVLLLVAVMGVSAKMKSIATSAKTASASLKGMMTSINVVQAGLSGIGAKASSAMNALKSKFSSAASSASVSGRKVGTNFANGMQGGLNRAKSMAGTASRAVASRLRSGASAAYSAGAAIGAGLANGMSSQLGRVRSIAAQLASAANAAIRAKAQIHSPSRVQRKNGQYFVEGWILGMKDGISRIRDTSMDMIQAAGAYGSGIDITQNATGSFEMPDGFDYGGTYRYTIEVPVNIDGKETAKVIAPYEDAIQKSRTKRENRKKGIR